MIELLCAVVIGMLFGYCFKGNNPTVNLQLSNKVEELEKEVTYYKELCKWHVDNRNKQ